MTFNEWVKKQNDEFFDVLSLSSGADRWSLLRYCRDIANGTKSNVLAGALSDCAYRVSTYKKKDKVVMQIINMKKEKRGIAICHENDKFDPEIGIAIAWARYKKEETKITTTTMLSKLKYKDKFFYVHMPYTYIAPDPHSCYHIIVNNETKQLLYKQDTEVKVYTEI